MCQQDKHLLEEIQDLRDIGAFETIQCNIDDPMYLGFQCLRH